MTWILVVLAVVAAVTAVLFALGATTPREHSATCRIALRATPRDVWQLITDWQNLPQWRKELRAVEAFDGGWVEVSKWGRLPMRIVRSEPEHLLELRIDDDKLPFGGTWSFRLTAAAEGTELSITEDGVIKSALFRAMARTVFGYHRTLEGYLRSLARRLGESAVPVRA